MRRRSSPTTREQAIFEVDPFVSIDRDGVGELVRIGTERGRKVRPDLKVGICGEHGGDPASIAFCHATGLDYVSCSPFRVPVARLAAAQAAIRAQSDRQTAGSRRRHATERTSEGQTRWLALAGASIRRPCSSSSSMPGRRGRGPLLAGHHQQDQQHRRERGSSRPPRTSGRGASMPATMPARIAETMATTPQMAMTLTMVFPKMRCSRAAAC